MAVTTGTAHHPLYDDLIGIVGPEYVSDEDFVLETYSRDTSPLPPNKQGIVVRPENTDQVVDIVNLSNTTKIPIVPSGGRASFYGTPRGLHGKGIVVDMTRMNKMINIDELNLTVTAEAGMTTSELTTRLWDIGWDVHTALQPFYPDTLGGQIAGFAGGGAGLELPYAGFNATHIAGLKVVLPNGSIVQTGAGAGSNIHNKMIYDRYPGNPDLTGMFIGDGGTFGIKVEATYKIYRLSPIRVPLAYNFDSFDQAYDCCLEMGEIEPLPYFNICLIPPTKMFMDLGMENKHMVITGAKGNTQKEVDAKVEILEEGYARHKGVVAEGPMVEDWKDTVVKGRRYREMGEFGTMGTWTYFEYYISRSQVKDCYHTTTDFIYNRLKEKGVKFHEHEGLVPTGPGAWIVSTIIFVRGEDLYAQQVMRELFAEATDLACSNGWYPDCHQGWGTRMTAKYWPKERYAYMKLLKGAVDPNNIMNPGVWDL